MVLHHVAANAAPEAVKAAKYTASSLRQPGASIVSSLAKAAQSGGSNSVSSSASVFFGFGGGFVSLVLPLISAADNFVVGAALGVGGKELPFLTVVIVAVANAAGMFLSSYVGRVAGAWAPMAAAIAAGLFCLLLGGLELQSWYSEEEGPSDKLANMAATQNAWLLALPMTLNNLATGLAGGLLGGSIWLLSFNTFAASFLLMYIGYFLGRLTGKALPMDTRFAIGVVFVGLGLFQLAPVAVGTAYV